VEMDDVCGWIKWKGVGDSNSVSGEELKGVCCFCFLDEHASVMKSEGARSFLHAVISKFILSAD